MASRFLLFVIYNHQAKIAHYSDSGSLPRVAGVKIINFLNNEDLSLFQERLSKTRLLKDNYNDRKFLDDYREKAPTWENEPDKRSRKQKRWFATYISRSLGIQLLYNILSSQDEEILLSDESKNAFDSLKCEYAYVIDFDRNTLEIYKGNNKNLTPISDRFYSSNPTNLGYFPVKLLRVYSLNALPSEQQLVKDCEFFYNES